MSYMDSDYTYSSGKLSTLSFSSVRTNLMSELHDSDENINIKDNKIKVYLRLRPLTEGEAENNNLRVIDDQTVGIYEVPGASKHETKKYTFTKVLGGSTKQEEVYNECVLPSMDDFISGIDCCVFCYGATNSGKTYTMQGTIDNPGIIPQAVITLFEKMDSSFILNCILKPQKYAEVVRVREVDKEDEVDNLKAFFKSAPSHFKVLSMGSSRGSNSDNVLTSTMLCDNRGVARLSYFDQTAVESDGCRRFVESPPGSRITQSSIESTKKEICSVWISCVEVYNDCIYDLLDVRQSKKIKALKLATDSDKKVFVKGAKYLFVSNAQDALKVMALASRNVQTASTKLNKTSSRSHSIYTIKLVRCNSVNSKSATVSTFAFCDLAGNERTSKTGNIGKRLAETCKINTSLLVLTKCVKVIRKNQFLPAHAKLVVPSRESKLTQLLKSHLEGHSNVVMMVNASKAALVSPETAEVLRISAVATKLVALPKTAREDTVIESSSEISLKSRSAATTTSVASDAYQTCKDDDEGDLLTRWMQLCDIYKAEALKLQKQLSRREIELRSELHEKYMKNLVEERQELRDQKDEAVAKAIERTEERYLDLIEAREKEAERRRLEEETPGTSQELNYLREKLRMLEKKLEDREDKLEEREKKLEEKEGTIQKLKCDLNEADRCKALIDTEQEVRKTLEMENESVRSQLEVLSKDNTTLKGKYMDMECERDSCQILLNEALNKMEEKEENLKKLQEKLENVEEKEENRSKIEEKLKNELTEKEKMVGELNNKILFLQTSERALKQARNADMAKIEKLKLEKDDLRKKYMSASSSIQTDKENCSQQDSTIGISFDESIKTKTTRKKTTKKTEYTEQKENLVERNQTQQKENLVKRNQTQDADAKPKRNRRRKIADGEVDEVKKRKLYTPSLLPLDNLEDTNNSYVSRGGRVLRARKRS